MINKKIVLFYSVYFIIGIFYVLILKDIINILSQLQEFVKELLIIIYVAIGFITPFITKKKIILIYFIYLFIFLFLRETKTGLNFEFYLDKWIKNIFTNKTIFINVVGNVVLFIPLGIILKSNLIYSYLVVILVELLQVILKRGIFDITDIILNSIGITIGFIGVLLWMTIKTKIKNQRKKILMKK